MSNKSKNEWQFDSLTPRQREVAAGIYAGLTSRQIGEKLGVSVRTVEVFRLQASRRLGTKNVADLFRLITQEKSHIKDEYPELRIDR